MADCGLNPLQYVKDVAKWIITEALWPSIKLHIDYWWQFDGNVRDLRDEIDLLARERHNMDGRIKEARLRAVSATTDVEDWSNEGAQKLEDATRILQGCDDLKKWKIIPRYWVGKSAKETAQDIAKLRNEVSSIVIADPTLEFQSRRGIEEDIMNFLKGGKDRMIAICGPGGVGKTTMAQRIGDRAQRIGDRVRKEEIFDEVVFVVVSQPIDMLRIQKQIAEILCLGLSGDTLADRAKILRDRLKDSKMKLIIFDDVWKSFDPEKIGVPNGGCKIILTSRNEDVCEEMGAKKVVSIKVLDKKEAWTLFREKCGDCVDDLDLRPIAEDVAAECKGLPIALVTVGKALRRRKINTWKDALFQLKGADPTDFLEVREHVYVPLKLSYDFLENQSQKDLFLLCCLFPEDYNIQIEELALLSFGLGLFEGITKIENGRNRTYHLLERLTSRFLLMSGGNEHEVKMHDVVRDVAIYIGSKEKHGFLRSLTDLSSMDSPRSCNWMSVDISIPNAKLPIGLDFPNLRLLMILNSNYPKIPEGSYVDDLRFEGMEELRVLYISYQNLQSLPSSLEFLKKLRKFHLSLCKVKDISVVGELASLEILSVWWCHDIEELPADVGKLKFLRLLELKDCMKLGRIVGGVISSLVGLEELKIINCFRKWEAKGNPSGERNASLSELESLRNLTSLEIEVSDYNLVAEEICLSQQLARYQIRFGVDTFLFYNMRCDRTIRICLGRDERVGNWIRQLAKSTQSLRLVGDGSTVKKLVNAIDFEPRVLEHLTLTSLQELEEVIDCRIPEGSNSFQNLKSIHIDFCTNLRYLFPMAIAQNLVQLEALDIRSCDTIEAVFWNEMESNTYGSIIEFPNLKSLYLRYLPNLAAFTTQGVEIIKSPRLTELKIRDCPKLRTKICVEFSDFNGSSSVSMIKRLDIRNCESIEEIFWNGDGGNRHILFPELRYLWLSDLPCLTTLCRGVESMKFPKLKRLGIGDLGRLNSFAAIDSEPTHDHHSLHFFCNQKVEIFGLETLYLKYLPDKIRTLWCQHIPISFFHNLKSLHISNVDGIRNSISSSIAQALVNLHILLIEDCKGMIDVIEDETHVPVNSVFPDLIYLSIKGMCKLRSFCQWKHAFELPSLEQVHITDCPLMKTFTLGSLSTKKLYEFRINEENIEMKDLNDGINHFITKIANEDENKDECNKDDKHEYSNEDRKEIDGDKKTESSKSDLT